MRLQSPGRLFGFGFEFYFGVQILGYSGVFCAFGNLAIIFCRSGYDGFLVFTMLFE